MCLCAARKKMEKKRSDKGRRRRSASCAHRYFLIMHSLPRGHQRSSTSTIMQFTASLLMVGMCTAL
jgi:hypothetical protein